MASDFGDAPAPYPTTVAENGPQHADVGPTLGATRDSEADGTHSAAADGDGADEDGVTFGTIQAGALGATVTVNVQNAPAGAKLDAWIDFNGDGNWGGEGEQIERDVAVVNGNNTITFDVPATALSGLTFGRFRLSTKGDLGPAGQAADGEVEDYQVTVIAPTPSGGVFDDAQIISGSLQVPSFAILADVDRDGDMDVLAIGQSGFQVSWFENDGLQNYTEHSMSTNTIHAQTLVAVDLDGDQDLDVLFTETGDAEADFRRKIGWYENDGNQTFTPHTILPDTEGYVTPSPVDMDGDGDLDILVPTTFADVMSWLENDGSQHFTPHIMGPIGVPSNVSTKGVAAADIDGDGDLDGIAVQFGNDSSISWYENDGNQNFTVHAIDSTLTIPLFVSSGDLDGDGDPDLLLGSRGDEAVFWYENQGAGQFARHVVSEGLGFYYGVSAEDFDGDGDSDVLATIGTPDDMKIIAWMENDGAGSFEFRTIVTQVPLSALAAAGDVDSDGDLDVISTRYNEGLITWFENLNAVDLSVSTNAGSEAGTTVVTVTATSAIPVSSNSTVALAVSGTNITAGDYQLFSTVITIPAGQLSGSVTFTIKNDTLVEGTETATLTLISPSTGLNLGNTSSQQITIADDDIPTIVSSATANVAENTPASTVILDVNTNPATLAGAAITFALTGPDAGLFQIDPTTGEIRFLVIPNFEAPADQGGDNAYHVTVTATAHVTPAAVASQDVTITVTSVNDNDPIFTSLATATVAENTPATAVVLDVNATDADLPGETLTYSLSGPDAARFTINASTGEIRFVSSPDFEAPADQGQDNQYHITVRVNDSVPTVRSVTQDLTITVTAVNDNAPVFTSAATTTLVENTPASTVILNVDAVDADLPAQTVSYSLTGPDAALFTINSATGEVRFITSPNFDVPEDQGGDNIYDVTVTATDSAEPPLSTTQNLTITVVNTNDFAPVFVDASPIFSLPENSAVGTIVGSVSATDSDLPPQTLTYSIISGNANSAFTIDPLTGQISVADATQLDFETHPSFTLNVRVTDNGIPEQTANAVVVINLTNVSEPPHIVFPNPTGTYHLKRSPAFIAPTASFTYSDVTNPNFEGAKLTVSIVSGRAAKDTLTIVGQGDGKGRIDVKGHKVLYGGTEIGTFTGGKGKSPDLVVTFNHQATAAAVDHLLRRLSFYAKTDVGTNREVSAQVTNIDGVDSNVATRVLAVVN